MSLLEKIVKVKQEEVCKRKKLYPLALLKQSEYYESPCVSMSSYIRRKDKTGIIAEFKRKSPSSGIINSYADIKTVTMGYMQSGASALSILTDSTYFGGSLDDLRKAREYNYCPILRKDFIIDEYMIHESRAAGADAILLIASCLTQSQIEEYIELSHQLGMEVLLEYHTVDEIKKKYNSQADCIGINNRDLHSMETNINSGLELINHIKDNKLTIAESGIHTVSDLIQLKHAGFDAFLIGTAFMSTHQPHLTCQHYSRTLFEATQLNVLEITNGVLGI